MPLRKIALPERYWPRIHAEVNRLGFSVGSVRLANAVLQLSDRYLQNPSAPSPFEEAWAQAAYAAYYFPLNYARAKAAAEEGARMGFFAGLERFVDFGSGPGSAAFALLETNEFPGGALALDRADEALRMQARLALDDFPALRSARGSRPPQRLDGQLASFSYSLTEISELPQWAMECEALFLLEPSSRDDGRKLQSLRARLLAAGFHAWAPCPHQDACPLLVESARDWCHARAFFEQPAWFSALEARLPMKNRTVSYSYLLARKRPPHENLKGAARTVGDPLREKGKTRIALCRGPNREFLAWFPQRMEAVPDLERGELVRLAAGLAMTGKGGGERAHAREIRLGAAEDVISLLPAL